MGWQIGYAEDCKSFQRGSIPLPISITKTLIYMNPYFYGTKGCNVEGQADRIVNITTTIKVKPTDRVKMLMVSMALRASKALTLRGRTPVAKVQFFPGTMHW